MSDDSHAAHATTADALKDTGALFSLLDRWVARGWLRALDRAFAAFLAREVPDAPAPLLLAAALASHQLGRGHVCLDLERTLAEPDLALSLPPEGDSLDDPPPLPSALLGELSLADWQAALAHPLIVGDGAGSTPLVLDGTRLYLRRYWHHERSIQQHIAARLGDAFPCRSPGSPGDGVSCGSPAETGGSSAPPSEGADRRPDQGMNLEALSQALTALFPPSTQLDWQKAACALAARSPFAVITGGPGTGKTTTVVKLLALLQTLALGAGQRPLRIRLAAPTGKAAARLNESIAGQVSSLQLDGLATLWEPDLSAKGQPPQNTTAPWEPDLSAKGQAPQDQEERLRRSIPTEVTTLHRLLGSRPDTRHFRHNARNPLPLDVLVVDEASMVDVEMMAALLDALPPRARLVLLGDKDQLASVEAGSVLGDLCARAEGGHFTQETVDWLAVATGQALPPEMLDAEGVPLDQAIAMLRVSHRFDAASGIGRLAGAVNRDAPGREKRTTIREVLTQGYADLSHLKLDTDGDRSLERLVVSGHTGGFPAGGEGRVVNGKALPPPVGYRHYLEVMKIAAPEAGVDNDIEREALDDWARAVLAAHGQFQLLCALRRGPWGVEGLNERIRAALEKEGLIDSGDGRRLWYPGRPVLVTSNDYALGLMNGDIGITLALPQPAASAEGTRPVPALRVAFPAGDGSGQIKWVLPSRLQAVETVFAMTVHKSQGSEFTHTALLLPDVPNPILTRELVYTGITRARHWLSLVETGRGQLLEAVERRVMRVSGLGRL
jgi:exodeoxyribonuclease V alpha subunit